jgi:peptidyl-prolyl cis-trans isomerase C
MALFRTFKDPLWLFLLFGGLLFAIAASQDHERVIHVTEGDVQRIVEQWQQQMRRDPTPAEQASLINQFIRDEAYYQEALALKLDAEDTIVKRRLIQKLSFLTEDLASTVVPDEATLRAFHAKHPENYRTPEQFSFSHIYFSADRPVASPEQRADVLAAKAVEDPTLSGDPFMLQRDYTRRSTREIGDLFGRAFAKNLAELPVQEDWQGPLRSAFGWHAVQLTNREPASPLAFEQVREKVVIDWKQQQRKKANDAYLKNLLASYSIQLPAGAQQTDQP